jgi:phosphoglycerate transport regulatory protein PgtC
MKKSFFAAIGVLMLASGSGLANAADSTLVVVTSFPKDLTTVFKGAFEKKYPGVKVEILSKSTSSGIKFVQETAKNNKTDLFWASAPDAFEVLKANNLLAKYKSDVKGIPAKIGAFPINDPDGYYLGFAASGYGIMWNTRYIKAKRLPVAKQWADLKKKIYHGHVGISAPSRSGTTHLTIETVLQGMGWDAGWGEWKAIVANAKSITERSFGVPDGVNSGNFGYGIVIDFFGLSSQAAGFPVEFVYPEVTTLVPANIGIIKNAPNGKVAGQFIDFLLSPDGQALLLSPKIRRLPVNPATYAKAPAGFPNPFKDKSIGEKVKFDLDLSKNRYNVVNSLFDVLITYRHAELRAAVKALQEAEEALARKPNAKAAELVKEAKALIAKMPIDEKTAGDPKYNAIFKVKRRKATTKVPGRQAEIEAQWDAMAKANYAKALDLAQKAKAM